ncbi:MAG: T9SS type A sorting domain-containing protein [Flavobacteriales bacterium]|nr:T9SS type A sorting domain-containing protein [Flavobacteriales bacterium]
MKNLRLIYSTFALVLFAGGTFAQSLFLVQEPSNLAGTYDFTDSYSADGWGADLSSTYVQAEAAWGFDDGTFNGPLGAAGDSACCGPIVNTSEVTGKIAFIYRGGCNFSLKAYQAQAAGAVGCVIVNNEPGNLVNMLAGDSATAVTIPTVFVSDATGAVLADSIAAGGVEIFIGNPNGVFTNNIGAYKPHIGMANAASLPSTFAQSSSDFTVPVGAWIFNYGSSEAVNAILSVSIDRDGTEVYNESSSGENIPAGDSLFVTLNDYSENGYQAGFYTMTYTMVSDATDDLPIDNSVVATFWINDEGYYSKSRVDPVDGPQGVSGLRPADGTEFEWCIAFDSEAADLMQVTGITFSTLTNDFPLTGEAVQLAVYEWNDPITTTVSFTDLVELTDNEFYDYADDLQGEFVTHTFSEPVELISDQKYLACATIFTDDMFLGVDGGIDYNVTYDSYPDEIFFPLNDIDGGQWYAAGFGSENVPALVANLELINGIADDVEALDVTPYPNPTVDMINIPLGVQLNGDLLVEVYDVTGALVMSENVCQKSSNLQLDVTGLSSGLHTFRLTFEDQSSTTFKVLVSR